MERRVKKQEGGGGGGRGGGEKEWKKVKRQLAKKPLNFASLTDMATRTCSILTLCRPSTSSPLRAGTAS